MNCCMCKRINNPAYEPSECDEILYEPAGNSLPIRRDLSPSDGIIRIVSILHRYDGRCGFSSRNFCKKGTVAFGEKLINFRRGQASLPLVEHRGIFIEGFRLDMRGEDVRHAERL